MPNEKFVQEFASDPVQAKAKYIPSDGNRRKVGILWFLDRIDGKRLILKEQHGIEVAVEAEEVSWKYNGKTDMFSVFAIGYVKRFDGRTISVECKKARVDEATPLSFP